MIDQYTSQNMNTKELAKYFSCSDDTIIRKLKNNGILIKKFHEDLSGKTFGKLLVLNKMEQKSRKIYWNCQCECGNKIIVCGDHLRQGKTLSCGCNRSKGEYLITKLLIQNHINFIPQYKFQDLKGEQGKYYRFDFGVLDRDSNILLYLIEYDGQQHFYYQDSNSWNSKENYEKTILRDEEKNKYCIKNKIPLIRIPYFHQELLKIEDLLLETTNFLYKEEI